MLIRFFTQGDPEFPSSSPNDVNYVQSMMVIFNADLYFFSGFVSVNLIDVYRITRLMHDFSSKEFPM